MGTEKRLIDANSDFVLKDNGYTLGFGFGFIHVWDNEGMLCQFDVDDIPTVDAVEVVHGRWICHEIEGTLRWKECSECMCEIHNVSYNYCPNCGAKMEGDRNA